MFVMKNSIPLVFKPGLSLPYQYSTVSDQRQCRLSMSLNMFTVCFPPLAALYSVVPFFIWSGGEMLLAVLFCAVFQLSIYSVYELGKSSGTLKVNASFSFLTVFKVFNSGPDKRFM